MVPLRAVLEQEVVPYRLEYNTSTVLNAQVVTDYMDLVQAEMVDFLIFKTARAQQRHLTPAMAERVQERVEQHKQVVLAVPVIA
jgi:hypothetical protein